MPRKLDAQKIVEAMKQAAKEAKKPKSVTPNSMTTSPKPVVPNPGIRVRDMRQEAMDGGSHGAKEYFGENQV